MPDDNVEKTRAGYILTGYDRHGNPTWELDPSQQVIKTRIIEWLNPLEQPAMGTDGNDPGLVSYYGQSEALRDKYASEKESLLSSLGEVSGSLADQLAAQLNPQIGGYSSNTGSGSISDSPGPILLVLVLAWYFLK